MLLRPPLLSPVHLNPPPAAIAKPVLQAVQVAKHMGLPVANPVAVVAKPVASRPPLKPAL